MQIAAPNDGYPDVNDLEALPSNFVPRTNYQRLVDRAEFTRRQTTWNGEPFTNRYREAHREFVGTASVRTLQACILPPGPAHVHKVNSNYTESNWATVRWVGLLTSLPYDYLTKVYGVATLGKSYADSLPIPAGDDRLDAQLVLRTLRLNCVTASYAPLWSELFDEVWKNDRFVAADDPTIELGRITSDWSLVTPFRTDYDRWLALCEIDAIVAKLLGLTVDQLIQMYRSQFAVLRKYEYVMAFDGNGRQLCNIHQAYGFRQAEWEADLKGTPLKRGEERVGMWDRVQAYRAGATSIDLGPFIAPFRPADRETAMRRAYRAFTERLVEQS